MAHGYKTLQHWNQWLTQNYLGVTLLAAEKQLLSRLLEKHFGKQTLLIGVPNQEDLFKATVIPYHSLISPLLTNIMHDDQTTCLIESDYYELPILTGSIDLVLLPHTLEIVDTPRQLLAEACRVVKPEGLIVICGFNPYSAWGVTKLLTQSKTMPWKSNFIQAGKIKNWLSLADFKLEQHQTTMFRPPLPQAGLYEKLSFLETIGAKCSPIFGGVYILLARAKVIPLTPIRMKWKQELSGIRISTTISGHIARHISAIPTKSTNE